MAVVNGLASIEFDCADPSELARFYTALTGWESVLSTDETVILRAPGLWVAFARVEDHRPPGWPAGEVPKQVHVDFAVDDLDVAEREAIALGATKPARQPRPEKWRVLVDPAGHPFCLNIGIPAPT
jgi:catechol 2,3-dioxygenase-like lactoylglutathione lyase family enzyme